MLGNTTIGQNQTWTISGDLGAVNADRGVFVRGDGSNKSLNLDGNLVKEGTGQLALANLNVGGTGNFVVNAGALKFNAGFNSLLDVGGSGNIQMNNDSTLMLSRNTGTLSVTRDIIMNNTSALHFGGGGSGASTTVESAITWNGTHALTALNNNPFTFSGEWSGSGTINRTSGGQTLTLSGDNTAFSGTLNLGSGTTNMTGDFDGATINVTGGNLVPFSGNLGNSNVNVTGGVVIQANGNTAFGTGTVTMSATSGTSRVQLNSTA